MKYKKWNEIQPLPCEVCACCKYSKDIYLFRGFLECKKYGLGFSCSDSINNQAYKILYDYCECNKSYPSFFRKLKFFCKKIHFFMNCLEKYLEDLRYHRFDD